MRSLISSFQAHVSQTTTPARTPGPAFVSQGPPERGPLDDGPVHPSEPESEMSAQPPAPRDPAPDKGHSGVTREGKRHGEGQDEKAHRKREPKERPKLVVYSKHEQKSCQGSLSSLTTDLNSKMSSNYDLDDSDDMEDFAFPLHSSSPKKDSIAHSEVHTEYSNSHDRLHSPVSLSNHSDDSDVTSLLIDQSTSTGDTVISRDLLNAPRAWKRRSSASSGSSSQRSSSRKSDVAPFQTKHSREVLENPKVRKQDVMVSSRATTTRPNEKELSSRKLGEGVYKYCM